MIDTRSDEQRAQDRQRAPQPTGKPLTRNQIAYRQKYGHLIDPEHPTPAIIQAMGLDRQPLERNK